MIDYHMLVYKMFIKKVTIWVHEFIKIDDVGIYDEDEDAKSVKAEDKVIGMMDGGTTPIEFKCVVDDRELEVSTVIRMKKIHEYAMDEDNDVCEYLLDSVSTLSAHILNVFEKNRAKGCVDWIDLAFIYDNEH